MGCGTGQSQIDERLNACLHAIQQMRQEVALEQVVAVDLAQLEAAFHVKDNLRPTVPCFAVRA